MSDEIDALKARVNELEELVAQLLMAPPPPPPPAGGGGESHEAIETVFPHVEAFIAEEFAPIYAKPIGGDFRWCTRWWEHVEAVSRFEALWRAWERLRLDPAFGMATWYRDFLDISLNAIVGPRGPFARCTPDRHEPVRPLPLDPAPAGYWDWPEDDPADDYAASSANGNSGVGGLLSSWFSREEGAELPALAPPPAASSTAGPQQPADDDPWDVSPWDSAVSGWDDPDPRAGGSR